MIIFQKIKYKNFLLAGDNAIEVDLNSTSSTLIVGKNGTGKSCLIDAISFALFGKPHRDISKGQIINSINLKDCVVELDFRVAQAQFRIVRGIKPNIFEIWQNGNLINQDSHARDYQKFLEQSILKLNHKSFHQIVVLGSSSFIPFMQLPTSHRREVIEDLLDIGVFSKMNKLLKEKVAKLRDDLGVITRRHDLISEKIKLQQKHISDLNKMDVDQQFKNNLRIEALTEQIALLEKANLDLAAKIPKYDVPLKTQLEEAQNARRSLEKIGTKIELDIAAIVKDAKFYDKNTSCPTCSQIISEDLKKEKTMACRAKAVTLSVEQTDLLKKLSDASNNLLTIGQEIEKNNSVRSQMSTNSSSIVSLQRQISQIKLENSAVSAIDIDSAELALAALKTDLEDTTRAKNLAYEAGSYNQAISEMLKDTGVKTKIIKQYLPVMNKLVNGYLQTMDFFVSFHLDDNFSEVIKSRHRDTFTYNSFSEGQKQRIDLSLLFAWRQIAKMKNSVSTNLLILDETFDSSVDSDGLESLLKILTSLEKDTNVFVISHKQDALDGKFKRKLQFSSEKNFSCLSTEE